MKRILLIVSLMFLSAASAKMEAQEQAIDPMKRIEAAKAQIKDAPAVAADAFNDILRGKNKKKPDLLSAVAQAYLDNGETETARTYLERLMELDNKYAPGYVLAGDIELAQNKVGDACSQYEQAIYFDPHLNIAYLKYAQAYASVNPELAIEMLGKLKSQDPSYIAADKELAAIYYATGQYGKAKDAYEAYFNGGKPDLKDISNYSMVLFLAKDYGKSLEVAKQGLAKSPDNQLLKRLALYDNYELKQYDEAIKAAGTFFTNPSDTSYVYLDNLYYGRTLTALKQAEKAIEQYQIALKKDAGKSEIWKELSDLYSDMKDYDAAIEAYDGFLKTLKEPEVSDLFMMGRLYYYAGSSVTDTDPASLARKKEILLRADSVFAEVATKVPDNYLGNFWRARTNSLLDPETTEGLAKPYYEAALAILESKPDASKPLVVECESYLGYYYFVKNDFPTSKVYWNKILTIDPENETAKKALEGIK